MKRYGVEMTVSLMRKRPQKMPLKMQLQIWARFVGMFFVLPVIAYIGFLGICLMCANIL